MQFRQLSVPGAYEFTPCVFPDDRGLFVAPFHDGVFREAVGHSLRLGQSNLSVSWRGAIRGVHFADTPPGQAKYIYCPQGALLDVVVDLRVGSPTFGKWDAARLDAENFSALYLAEGLGHGFIALEDDTVMAYLCSEPYNPAGEHGINPLDPQLGLPWPAELTPILSEKDLAAPSLAEALETNLLPHYGDCVAYYDKLRSAR